LARDLRTLFSRHPAGDARAREAIILGFLAYARQLARPYRGRGELVEDLYQAASVGLIKAVDQREPERGVSFIAYATPTIRGEIRRHFRDTARRVMYLVRSRNAPAGSSAPKRSSWQGPVLTRPVGESDSAYKRVETSAGLGHALRKLQPRERKVLLLRFGCEFTQGEIARRIGVSQMHVSRILRNAIGAVASELQ
jgi:RNA polymerase sigma factor, sigma-70 family